MKTVTATIKPFKVDEVKAALAAIGQKGFRVIDVKGFGKHRGHTDLYKGTEYVVDYLPKVDIVITVHDKDVDRVVEAILNAAHTGRHGDGRITVTHTEQFWSIRTREPAVVEDPATV